MSKKIRINKKELLKTIVVGENEKRCYDCYHAKPLDEFYKIHKITGEKKKLIRCLECREKKKVVSKQNYHNNIDYKQNQLNYTKEYLETKREICPICLIDYTNKERHYLTKRHKKIEMNLQNGINRKIE